MSRHTPAFATTTRPFVDEQAEDVEAHARVMGNDNETVAEDQASASADDQT